MEILLVRHAQAGSADAEAYPDDNLRPITAKGRKAFKLAAKGLNGLGTKPAQILASPALRTRATAEILADAMGIETKRIQEAPELHHSISPAKALEKLSRLRMPGPIALVGHEPWLSRFLSLLIAGNDRAGIGIDKGGACLVEADAFAKGKGRLVWLMTREQLEALA